MDEVYFLASILGQYVLLIAIYRETSAAKEAINTLKEWKEDATAQIRRLELEHAANHRGTPE